MLLPLAAVVAKSTEGGMAHFWDTVSSKQSVSALKLTLACALIVAAINAVFGTLVAWVLVRDEFPGKRVINALIDLPFALPTVVAGITLLALYGPKGPWDQRRLHASRDRPGAAVRDAAVRGALRAAGADRARPRDGGGRGVAGRRPGTIFRRIVLPNLMPAIVAGRRSASPAPWASSARSC